VKAKHAQVVVTTAARAGIHMDSVVAMHIAQAVLECADGDQSVAVGLPADPLPPEAEREITQRCREAARRQLALQVLNSGLVMTAMPRETISDWPEQFCRRLILTVPVRTP
jgi:hypothetical protein